VTLVTFDRQSNGSPIEVTLHFVKVRGRLLWAGVCEGGSCDVRALSRVRPATDSDHSNEERQPRAPRHGHDEAGLASERRRRSAVRTDGQLRPSVCAHRRWTVYLLGEQRPRQTDDALQTERLRLATVSSSSCITALTVYSVSHKETHHFYSHDNCGIYVDQFS